MNEMIPTHDKDLEQIVLAGLMAEPSAIIENPVNSDWFYLDEHRKIAGAILELKTKGVPIDIFQIQFTLNSKNELEEIGGMDYLFQISNRVASAINIKHHIRILVDLHTRREMAAKAMRTYQKAYDLSVDVDDLVKEWQSNTLELMEFNQSNIVTVETSLQEIIEQAKRNQQGNQIIGIPTGLSKLDKHTGGMQKGDLIIVAGETSQGKTAFAISIIRNIIRQGYKAAAYSLEMTHRQLTARIIAQTIGISSKKILTSILSKEELNTVQGLKNSLTGLYYDERSNNSIDNICSSIRRLKLKYDINLAVVDFLQIVSGDDRKSDESRLADIARKLKNVAKEQNITILALSQLSRDKQRPAPTIARLRGSGQLEEAADLILLLYRPEVYGLAYDDPFQNEPTTGTAQVIIGKGRNVGIGTFLLTFNSETTGFF
ncbi:MAG: replicative DNA helicase [Mangrovibacterium sp.]